MDVDVHIRFVIRKQIIYDKAICRGNSESKTIFENKSEFNLPAGALIYFYGAWRIFCGTLLKMQDFS